MIRRTIGLTAAREIGYPLLVKPAEAGGGRGLRFVADESALIERGPGIAPGEFVVGRRCGHLSRTSHDRAATCRGPGRGRSGRAIAVGDRDCSIQRRHQKVIEEAPAPNIDDSVRANLHEYARRIAEETGLDGIATLNFCLMADGEIAFLEVNPRIQVEHPVTELVTGVDLVEWQF